MSAHGKSKQQVFEEGIVFGFGGLISRSLPKEGISKVIVSASVGALSGGSSGSYIPNTIIESIQLLIDGVPLITFDGRKGIAGQMSMGIATLREFYKHLHNAVAMPDELFVVELPDALPKGREVQLKVEMAQNIASIQTSGGDRTTLATTTFDILYEMKDLVPKKALIPYVGYQEFDDGANTGFLIHYLNALGVKLRTLIMITFDGTTLADTTYDRLELAKPREPPYFNGKLALLKEKFASHGVSLATGFYMYSWKKGITVPADTLKLNFYAGTAGTNKRIHVAWIGY